MPTLETSNPMEFPAAGERTANDVVREMWGHLVLVIEDLMATAHFADPVAQEELEHELFKAKLRAGYQSAGGKLVAPETRANR